MASNLLKQTLAMGLPPLQLEYHPYKSNVTTGVLGYRTVLRINSVDLGVLYPNQYRIVTNRNRQSIKLATWCLNRVCNNLRKVNDFVSIYIPAKMLLKGETQKIIESILANDPALPLHKLCFEFSSEILLSDTKETVECLNKIKEYGIKLMLSEFGYEFCPTMRLAELPFDIVVLDPTICTNELMGTPQVNAIISMITQLGMEVSLEITDSQDIIQKALDNGCIHSFGMNIKAENEVFRTDET